MMHHLKLIKALSYCGVVSATIAHPDVLVDEYWKFKSKYAAPTTIRQKVLAIVQTYIPFAYKWIIQRTLK